MNKVLSALWGLIISIIVSIIQSIAMLVVPTIVLYFTWLYVIVPSFPSLPNFSWVELFLILLSFRLIVELTFDVATRKVKITNDILNEAELSVTELDGEME